jgi:oxygen-independent coproporphyrinogen III oxidase
MTDFPPEPGHMDPTTPEFLSKKALAAKYGSQGPRYTSYPTAPQLKQNFPREKYYNWLRDNQNKDTSPLSLYVHIPFCDNICYYCGCNKIVTREENAARDYLHHLKAEIVMQSELIGNTRPVTQMHWGGGTPNYLDNAEITELMHILASHFHLVDKNYREYSIEVDPRTIDQDTIALLRGLGFNRISLGIQDFDALVQKTINRVQPYAMIKPLVDCIRSHGFRSLSFDLIYGLPYQDRHTIEETMRKVIALGPDRIACYNYAHLPERFPGQRAIDRHNLPEPEEKLLLHYLITHRLQDAGYTHIGMDHYVLPEDELAIAQQEGRLQRNFQGYSLQMADDLLGLGPSAISQIGDYTVQNECDLASYYSSIEDGSIPAARGCQVSDEDKLLRYIIMSLICELELDIIECNRRFGIDFATRFDKELGLLRDMEADGLLLVNSEEIRIQPLGRPFLRNICMLFDAYLKTDPGSPQPKGYSATI